ncbi:MAG: AAA family ATPase [Actinobacteria bacterium]|nr:AAA family ATPase [Actinomycetota bacterium]
MVVLNGGSSSGKSTLARAFRDARAAVGDFWLVIGIDDYFSRLPEDWLALGDHVGRFSSFGMTGRFTKGGGVEVSFGPVGRALLSAYQGAVAAAAHAGIQVVVDEVIFDRPQWDGWGAALQGLDVVWVGVRCDPEVAEARELARGDRTPGKARGSASLAHEHARYDFTIDTSDRTPSEALAELLAVLGF